MRKSELRQHVRMMKQQFTVEQLRKMSQPVVRRLLSNPAVAGARTILLYYSLDDEVCTHELLEQLLAKGKTVLLPVVVNDGEMELRHYTGLQDLQEGFFNVMEPIGEPYTDYDCIDVAVVPGMSFDTRGNRLGRGKGYYDRFLLKIPKAYKIGICFDFQRLPGIPTDKHDVAMDLVI